MSHLPNLRPPARATARYREIATIASTSDRNLQAAYEAALSIEEWGRDDAGIQPLEEKVEARKARQRQRQE